MNKDEVRERILKIGIIPAVRVGTADEARFAVEAVASGGIPIVEITLTVPGAIEVIRDLVTQSPEIIVGAGTVLNADTVHRCVDAGAHFITTPVLKEAVVEAALARETLMISGAMTPSEVLAAWESGANFVTVFPCSALGGPTYIRSLKRPFPQIPMIAAGGINQQNAAEYIRVGADAIGIGTGLVSPETVSHHQAKRIRELARRYLSIVAEVRDQLHGSGNSD
jgi:2-dehydro-3-deoxyphosphogluconate aldolase/(4S)-4-hydroxy-2-oxoglutarate aldolase